MKNSNDPMELKTLYAKRAMKGVKDDLLALENELDYWKRIADNSRECYERRVSKFVELKISYDEMLKLAEEMLADVPQEKFDDYYLRLSAITTLGDSYDWDVRDISSPLDED